MRTLVLALLPFIAGAAVASPGAAVAAAAADCARLPADAALRTRYLSLYNVSEKLRAETVTALSYHVNSLSREAHLQPPRRVGPDLLAVDLRDYGWDRKVWERLVNVEPYFHATVRGKATVVNQYWPGGVWRKADGGDDRHWDAGTYPVEVPGKKVVAHAPWLPAKEAAALALRTGSEVPVVRADWFVFQTAIAADRVAGYYDFLALGKAEKDFDDLIGADQEKSRKAKREVIGLVARSGVTLQNRAVVRLGAASGGYWLTVDFKKSTDRSNVLRQLDKDLEPPAGDASERYGFLPNNLFAFWLQNGQGQRQDTAPDFIASDRVNGTSNDARIHIGLSCVRCHVEGLRPIKDYARRLYRGSIQLASPDHDKLVRLRQLYLSDLDQELQDDAARYARALKRLTGWKPAELAKAYGQVWDRYAEADLAVDDAARELGITPEHLVKALKATGPRGLDPVLAGLIADEVLEVRREHWEEVYPLAQQIIREVKP